LVLVLLCHCCLLAGRWATLWHRLAAFFLALGRKSLRSGHCQQHQQLWLATSLHVSARLMPGWPWPWPPGSSAAPRLPTLRHPKSPPWLVSWVC